MRKNSKGKNSKKMVEKENRTSIISFPMQLDQPVYNFLKAQLTVVEKRRKELTKDDPFRDTTRLIDNASPDADAAEQFGHARVTAMKEQLDRKIVQLRKAMSMIKLGKYGVCEDCGRMIDTDRLMVFPETTLCADDAKKRER